MDAGCWQDGKGWCRELRGDSQAEEKKCFVFGWNWGQSGGFCNPVRCIIRPGTWWSWFLMERWHIKWWMLIEVNSKRSWSFQMRRSFTSSTSSFSSFRFPRCDDVNWGLSTGVGTLGPQPCTGWVQATGWWQVIGLCFVYVRVFVDFRRAVCWSRNLALLWFVMSICLWRELQAAKLGSKSNCSLFAHVAIKVHSPSCTCQHGCQPRTGKLANVSLSDCTGGLHFWIIKVPMLPFLWQSWPFVSHLMRSWEAGVAHVPECLSAGPTLPKNQWTLNKSLWDGFCLELMFSWYQWEWFEWPPVQPLCLVVISLRAIFGTPRSFVGQILWWPVQMQPKACRRTS